ncbi:CLUMA_CG011501, isoform A [Clunio marinus]|uniref:CLUMA_CG011501, isoform A n=1 Tax=Clunio marinus TaxID=568069 RepID=A0A1J1ICX3_9DIPT|nr:CLUMA_CG011501, isoform A [Clunio marinus]
MNSRAFKFRPYELVQEFYNKGCFEPGPRSGHRMCCDESNLFVYGGYNFESASDSHNLYKEILSYNFVSRKWRKVNTNSNLDDKCPDELASSSMIMFGNTLVVFGGTSYPFGMQCSNKVTLISINYGGTYRIEELQTLNEEREQPPGQYGILDFASQCWKLLALSRPEIDADHPIGRYRHEIAIDERFIYIFGGGTADVVFDLKTIPVYDLKYNKWDKISTFPDPDQGYPNPRKCHSLVQHTIKDCDKTKEETFIFIAGGNCHEGPLNDIWKMSLSSRQWICFRQTSLRTSLFFHDACITPDGAMYIFGGITTNLSRSNNLYKIWVKIPKLSVICWEAYLHYFPRIYRESREFMLKSGIPIYFTNRVHNQCE